MRTIPQRLLAVIAVPAMAVALYNGHIAAGIVAAGALVAWAIVTVFAARLAD